MNKSNNDPKYYFHNNTIQEKQKCFANSDNIALRHNYFISFSQKKELKIHEHWLDDFDKLQPTSHIQSKITRSIQHKKLCSNLMFKQFFADTNDQMLVGFGNSHIHETSLNFHPVYGNPYISGSMLKGISRVMALRDIRAECLSKLSYSLDELEVRLGAIDMLVGFLPASEKDCLAENLKKESLVRFKMNEKKDNKISSEDKTSELNIDVLKIFEEYFLSLFRSLNKEAEISQAETASVLNSFWLARMIFGNQYYAGQINFHDAFTDINRLDITVFATHNQDYFKEKSEVPPADYQQTIPIKYLALPKKSKFFFEVSASKDCPEKIYAYAENILKDALKNLGVGAKTALGFGTFESFCNISEQEAEKAQIDFFTERQLFLHNLKKMENNTILQALKKPAVQGVTELLYAALMTDHPYNSVTDKSSLIRDIMTQLKAGNLSKLSTEEKLALIKHMESFAEGKFVAELKNFRKELNPQTQEIPQATLKINKDNFEKIFNELQNGQHQEHALDLYKNMLKGLKTWKVKIKEKKRNDIMNKCDEAINKLS